MDLRWAMRDDLNSRYALKVQIYFNAEKLEFQCSCFFESEKGFFGIQKILALCDDGHRFCCNDNELSGPNCMTLI